MPPRPRRLAVAATVAVTALAVPAGASADDKCTRYAAPAGSDQAAGSAAAPLRTAQALADSLQPGETGCLRSGTYTDQVTGPYVVRFNHGGAPGAPVRLRSAPGERAALRGIISVARGSDHVTLSDVDVDGRRVTGDDTPIGIQVTAANTVIERNTITNHRAASCLTLGVEGWGSAVRPVVRENTFHECGDTGNGMLDHAIYLNAVSEGRIVDNLLLDTAAYAVHFYGDVQRTTVAHNVMEGNGGGVIFAGYDDKNADDNVVAHNVIANSTVRPAVEAWWGGARGAGNVARSNCVNGKGISAGNGGFAAEGNVSADPGFADAAAGDYRLANASCLAAVGYDTAAKLRGEAVTAPQAVPATADRPAAKTRSARRKKAHRARCGVRGRWAKARRAATSSARCKVAGRSSAKRRA